MHIFTMRTPVTTTAEIDTFEKMFFHVNKLQIKAENQRRQLLVPMSEKLLTLDKDKLNSVIKHIQELETTEHHWNIMDNAVYRSNFYDTKWVFAVDGVIYTVEIIETSNYSETPRYRVELSTKRVTYEFIHMGSHIESIDSRQYMPVNPSEVIKYLEEHDINDDIMHGTILKLAQSVREVTWQSEHSNVTPLIG